jgi:hypothetical protein
VFGPVCGRLYAAEVGPAVLTVNITDIGNATGTAGQFGNIMWLDFQPAAPGNRRVRRG